MNTDHSISETVAAGGSVDPGASNSNDRDGDTNDITATVIGYKTNSAGETQTYAFPAILGGGSVEYGTPTQISDGGAEETSGALGSRFTSIASPSSSAGAATITTSVLDLGGTATMSDDDTTMSSVPASVNSVSTTTLNAIESATSSPQSSTSASSSSRQSGSNDGTLSDVGNEADKRRAGSLLGLTMGLLAGVAWF